MTFMFQDFSYNTEELDLDELTDLWDRIEEERHRLAILLVCVSDEMKNIADKLEDK